MDRIIIYDTSCLIALHNIKLLHVLKELYGEILITSEVKNEFGEKLPEWIITIQVQDKIKQAHIEKQLDKGEASSIALALEIPNSVLIIDEIKGRTVAKSFNLEIIGTIGILILAEKKGLINGILRVVQNLMNQGFRLSQKILNKITEAYGKP